MPCEERVTLTVDGITPAAWGLLNRGRPADGIRPWADLVVADLAILADVVAWVGRGGAVMVAYNADDTECALRRRVPPAATPVGLALLDAGCRWFFLDTRTGTETDRDRAESALCVLAPNPGGTS